MSQEMNCVEQSDQVIGYCWARRTRGFIFSVFNYISALLLSSILAFYPLTRSNFWATLSGKTFLSLSNKLQFLKRGEEFSAHAEAEAFHVRNFLAGVRMY